ncbi:MAG: LytR/AlgR family response regulator transcription factor [Daejeonella sp.]
MITCYVVDDERDAIEILESYIIKAPGLKLLGSFTNPLEALEKINNEIPPDITFMDVDMPELSGLELAELISDRTTVIFTTAYPQHALTAFEKNVRDYLLKPISFERFLASIKKVSAKLVPHLQVQWNDYMFIKSNIKGKLKQINVSNIIYIESIKNYLVIHTLTEDQVTYLSMREFEAVLPADKFFRVHRSYIVNVEKIRTVNGSILQLEKDITIPLGLKYKEPLQAHISKNLISSARFPTLLHTPWSES